MSEIDVEALFRKVMSLPPADRLRMAAGLIEAGRSDLLGIAVDVAKSAVSEVEAPLVLAKLDRLGKAIETGGTLSGADIARRTGEAQVRSTMRSSAEERERG